MLNISSDNVKVPHSTFFAYMSYLRRIFIDPAEMDKQIAEDRAILDTLENLMLEYIRFFSGSEVSKFKPEIIRNYLMNCEGVSQSIFEKFDTKKRIKVLSMDETILKRLIKFNISPYLIELYNDYQQLATKASGLKMNRNALLDTSFNGSNHKPICAIPFYYTMETTGRIYSKSIDVQGWTSRYNYLIQSLDDYFLLWGDFSQIDLRIAFELCLMGDSEFQQTINSYPDRYEGFARAMYASRQEPFDEEQFKKDRNTKFKSGILAPIYGMSSENVSSKVGDVKVGTSIHHYINSNPTYIAYKENINRNLNSNLDFYTRTYFGTKIPISQAKDNKAFASLNTPIQGTTGDVMKIVMVEIIERMRKHARNDNLFVPLFNKHDETIFMVHKSLKPYLYDFIDCTKIQVDDWAELEIKWSAGYRYKETDEDLVNEILEHAKGHELTPKQKHTRKAKYFATPRIYQIGLEVYTYKGHTFITMYEYLRPKARSFYIETNYISPDKIYNIFVDSFEVQPDDFDRIIFYGNIQDYFLKNNNKLEVIFTDIGKNVNIEYNAKNINNGLAIRFFEKNSISYNASFSSVANLDYRKGIDYKCQILT